MSSETLETPILCVVDSKVGAEALKLLTEARIDVNVMHCHYGQGSSSTVELSHDSHSYWGLDEIKGYIQHVKEKKIAVLKQQKEFEFVK